MKHKTSELTGALLDAAVAKAEGWTQDEVAAMVRDPDGAERYLAASTQWGIAGPICDREAIDIEYADNCGGYFGEAPKALADSRCRASIATKRGLMFAYADASLIAAMRAYVASKLGDEVELP